MPMEIDNAYSVRVMLDLKCVVVINTGGVVWIKDVVNGTVGLKQMMVILKTFNNRKFQ